MELSSKTGILSFGPEHDEKTLRGIAAFVNKLSAMSPARLNAAGGGGDHPYEGRDAKPAVLFETAGDE